MRDACNWSVVVFGREREFRDLLFGTRNTFCQQRKGKCFPLKQERKTLSGPKALFFSLTGIEFPLTDFPHACQTWENGENGFQKNEFLETNKA